MSKLKVPPELISPSFHPYDSFANYEVRDENFQSQWTVEKNSVKFFSEISPVTMQLAGMCPKGQRFLAEAMRFKYLGFKMRFEEVAANLFNADVIFRICGREFESKFKGSDFIDSNNREFLIRELSPHVTLLELVLFHVEFIFHDEEAFKVMKGERIELTLLGKHVFAM